MYKRRGLGMFVAPDARARIQQKRRTVTLHQLLAQLAAEARRLDIPDEELLRLLAQTLQKEV